MFIPPRSPYSLIQEDLFNQPFWLLTVCVLLNRSSRVVAQTVLTDLMKTWPTASDVAAADQAALSRCIKRLGFVTRRTEFIINLARAAASNQDLLKQKGVGEYARRSYQIFCLGELGESEPDDGPLKRYWRWRVSNDRGTRDHYIQRHPISVCQQQDHIDKARSQVSLL